MQKGKSYIRDSNDFIDKIKNINSIPGGALLVTADVVGLYPSIPHDLGLKALKEELEKRESKSIATDDLLKMAKFVLENNYFEFNGEVKQQISGTAIGTKFAPPYACIFMDQVENEFLETQERKPLVWFRYIDDIFFIWTHGRESLQTFIDDLNTFHPNLKFTHEFSEKSVTFLDLKVNLSNGSITTDLHIKPTEKHHYLHFSSSHPDHTKRSIIYSQALRISRICTFEKDFNRHATEMKSWFRNRGYPDWLINREMSKVKHNSNNKSRANKKVQGVPFVVTYHPLLKNFGQIIKKHLYLLYMNEEMKEIFTPSPMISLRGARKLSSYLVRAKLYPLERSVGSFKCNSPRCQVCHNVKETDRFSSSVSQETYKINHRFNCNDKCLIYLLTCKKCHKQYVGKTVDSFRFRWNNYKNNNRKFLREEACMQQHLFEHFSNDDHSDFLDEVEIIFIDKTDSKDPNKRERYWRHTLRTMAPEGLNIEDD